MGCFPSDVYLHVTTVVLVQSADGGTDILQADQELWRVCGEAENIPCCYSAGICYRLGGQLMKPSLLVKPSVPCELHIAACITAKTAVSSQDTAMRVLTPSSQQVNSCRVVYQTLKHLAIDAQCGCIVSLLVVLEQRVIVDSDCANCLLAQAICVLQDLHALASACCRTAHLLHSVKLVHRDLRMPNVVQLGQKHYMVIDLESVANLTAKCLPRTFTVP